MVKPYPTITPYLVTTRTSETIEFLKKAFDAEVLHIQKTDQGNVAHASLKIQESMVMLSESSDAYPPMPGMLYVYMDNCDVYYNRAMAAGGISLREPTNEAYGDRSCGVKDMGGNQWWIAGPLKSEE